MPYSIITTWYMGALIMKTETLITEGLHYIELHLQDDITVAEISRAIGYSESYFSREFKKIMKISVMDYVKRRRLRRASEKILDGEKVIDVAMWYGWKTHSGFTRTFKQEFGFCPSLLKAMAMQIEELGGNRMEHAFLKKTGTHFTKEELFRCLIRQMKLAGIPTDHRKLEALYFYACRIYEGKVRYSGDEYITHPLNVAILLAEMNANEDTIYAGLFCDALTKTSATIEQLRESLPVRTVNILEKAVVGEDIWESEDIDEEVVMMKLAERLHNMRTAQFVTEKQRRQRAEETIRKILPVARKMGNARLTDELNDLAVKYLCDKDLRQ